MKILVLISPKRRMTTRESRSEKKESFLPLCGETPNPNPRRGQVQIELKSGKIRLVGELFTPPSLAGIHPALIICHGVPQAPPDPADRGYPLMAERFAGDGFVTLLFNFRGTGESQGNFHLLGWAEDLRAALDYLCSLAEVDPNRVSTLGFSGGAAVSIYVAAQDERIRSLVACASPANFDTLFRPESAQSFVEQARRLGIIREASFPQDLEAWLEE
ncbi:MAG: alpha/beta fold hydrolase, partial [Chloroflexi bacterium]|nr:alpha/beta fold hydrolase [Chloroflexota bacterium]